MVDDGGRGGGRGEERRVGCRCAVKILLQGVGLMFTCLSSALAECKFQLYQLVNLAPTKRGHSPPYEDKAPPTPRWGRAWLGGCLPPSTSSITSYNPSTWQTYGQTGLLILSEISPKRLGRMIPFLFTDYFHKWHFFTNFAFGGVEGKGAWWGVRGDGPV